MPKQVAKAPRTGAKIDQQGDALTCGNAAANDRNSYRIRALAGLASFRLAEGGCTPIVSHCLSSRSCILSRASRIVRDDRSLFYCC